MDVVRKHPRRRWRVALWIVAVLGISALVGAAIVSAKPRPESVRRATIWSGRVESGPFVVRVRGAGTLVPEAVRWLTAESSGRVEEVLNKPGTVVEASTPVVRLENLDIRLLAVQAEQDVANARSELLELERTLGAQEIANASAAVSLNSKLSDARRRAEAYTSAEGSFVPLLDAKQASDEALELEQRRIFAEQNLALVRRAGPEEIKAMRTQVERCTEVSRVRQELVDHLLVRSGAKGILQDVMVELGQWVVPGSQVAKVIVSDRLKAELGIPEQQVAGVSVGQPATVETGAGSIPGVVRRVAAAASQGTVKVEIALEGELPRGTRPDQSVHGYIEIERVPDTLHIPRPVNVQPNVGTSLFRIDPKSALANRVQVRTGRTSVDTLEVLSGLAVGDEVILSDTSRYADQNELILE
jgi:HlyD family secretion protein